MKRALFIFYHEGTLNEQFDSMMEFFDGMKPHELKITNKRPNRKISCPQFEYLYWILKNKNDIPRNIRGMDCDEIFICDFEIEEMLWEFNTESKDFERSGHLY